MPSSELKPAIMWNSGGMVLLAIANLLIIATDQRPDDTSVRVSLCAVMCGIFATMDLFINKSWHKAPLFRGSWLLPLLVMIFLAFCSFSALWVGESLRTLEVMASSWVLYLSWLVIRFWADRQPKPRITALMRCMSLSIAAFAVLLFFETTTDQSIHYYLVNSLGMSMSIPNYYAPVEHHINILMQFLSQHIGTLSYLFWPVITSIYLTFGRWKGLGIIVFSGLSSYSILNSVNETAILAFTLSAMVFLAALFLPRITFSVSAIAYTFVVLGIVPLAHMFYDTLQLQLNPYIPPSGQGRFEIWYRVAGFVSERLFFGHGVVHLQALLNSGQGFISEHAHSHNVFLQLWYEVGFFGVLLVLLIGLMILRDVFNYPRLLKCFSLSGLVVILVSFTTTAWELWVPWHLGLVSLVAVFDLMISRLIPVARLEPA